MSLSISMVVDRINLDLKFNLLVSVVARIRRTPKKEMFTWGNSFPMAMVSSITIPKLSYPHFDQHVNVSDNNKNHCQWHCRWQRRHAGHFFRKERLHMLKDSMFLIWNVFVIVGANAKWSFCWFQLIAIEENMT